METLIVTQIINVLYGVAVLAMLAVGLAIVFGLLGVLNIAHGEFVMLGAYSAHFVDTMHWPFPAAFPIAVALSAALGFVVERWIIRPLYRRPFDTLVATWGVSLLMRKLTEALFGPQYYNVSIPVSGAITIFGASYPAYRLLIILISLTLIGVLTLWYLRSRAGDRVRAMVGNPELAQAVGISTRRLAAATFVLGVCLASFGGVLIAPVVPVEPFMGVDYALTEFFALVVGGLGSVAGLFAGAAIVGGLDSVVSALSDATDGYFAMLLVTILFLWLRPRGLIARI